MIIAPVALPVKQADIIERYGVAYCRLCAFPAAYCKGHAAPDAPTKDGADTSLAKRIAEAVAKAKTP